MENKVEKQIEIAAPVAKVWDALTDAEKFGTWFRVKLEGPFVAGEVGRAVVEVDERRGEPGLDPSADHPRRGGHSIAADLGRRQRLSADQIPRPQFPGRPCAGGDSAAQSRRLGQDY